MANLGLTDETLREWNPNLVILSLPGFGSDGPWSGYVGFAPTIEQLSGLPRLTGYGDGPPALSGNSVADPTAGLTGALALISAILAARRGAPPARLDVSQLEAMTFLLGEALLEQQATGVVPVRTGNRDKRYAPQGCYPCAGEDRWLVLSVRDGTDWRALCGVLDRSDLAADLTLSTLEGRRRRHDRIDEAIASWTRSRDASEASELLQSHGLAAAPVMSPAGLLADPHLAARHYFADLDRPGLGVHPHAGMPFHFSETPGRLYAASPTLGQHNDAVLRGILGIPESELARLSELGVIGMEAL
jgi:crotonobetainyl-CoA:carnitine CoA-transferase CaiB-like acyl-CoA transferase